MYGLLICIYLYLGFDWAASLLDKVKTNWTLFIANILLWPIFSLISMVSCLVLKPNYVLNKEIK